MEFDFNEMLRNFCSNKKFGIHGNEPVSAFAVGYDDISSALHTNYEWNEIRDAMVASNIHFSETVDDYANYYGEFIEDFTTDFNGEPYTVYIVEFMECV